MSLRSRAAAVSCLGAVVLLGVGVEIFLATSIPYREHNLSRANLAQSLLTVPCALTLLPLIFESMVKVCVDKPASSRKFRHVSQQEHDLIRKMHAGQSDNFRVGRWLWQSMLPGSKTHLHREQQLHHHCRRKACVLVHSSTTFCIGRLP